MTTTPDSRRWTVRLQEPTAGWRARHMGKLTHAAMDPGSRSHRTTLALNDRLGLGPGAPANDRLGPGPDGWARAGAASRHAVELIRAVAAVMTAGSKTRGGIHLSSAWAGRDLPL